ncbi:MAG TPA: hypothetical protein VKG63_01080 [Steroidobacteraceae bacterium]|nr:hypothetical protein [Steroidobacteraceae bacterium]
MSVLATAHAQALHVAGVECSETGNEDQAIENYTMALALDPARGDTLYNLGLIYKYRGDWAQSLDFNRRARALQPDDEATLWNLAIAATAMRDWGTARAAWSSLEIITEPGEGPIEENRGKTPVRLNADERSVGTVEVVWSRALCPVRSRVINIPTGETHYRHGDVVLHDGAAVGYRVNSAGQECPVFNVLEIFEPSKFSTYEARTEVESLQEIEALERLCEDAGIAFEDWTASIRSLCKACSEGRPHEGHDHEPKESGHWESMRRIAFATIDADRLNSVIDGWSLRMGRRVVDLRCTLEAKS